MAPMYYRGAHAAILVFDITKPMTLHNAMSWVDELRLHGNDDTIIVFAANKSDLKGGSNQASAVACPTLRWARDHVARILPHAEVVETSAKTGQGIAMLFHTVATRLYQEEERREEERHREREAREKERGRGRGGREEKKSVRVGEENAGQHNSLDANGCC